VEKVDFRAGDRPLIPCIVSDLSDYVNFRLYRGGQMGILHREDAAGQQICAHLSLREADGANPQSGRLSLPRYRGCHRF